MHAVLQEHRGSPALHVLPGGTAKDPIPDARPLYPPHGSRKAEDPVRCKGVDHPGQLAMRLRMRGVANCWTIDGDTEHLVLDAHANVSRRDRKA